jgi:hypothetical protein
MFFLLSGEGARDVGTSARRAVIVGGGDFEFGPMAEIVAKVVHAKVGRDVVRSACGFLARAELTRACKTLKPIKLSGVKSQKETAYYYKNAQAMAGIAKQESNRRQCPVIAVLFRDGDGTCSSDRTEWQSKVDAMEQGFKAARFDNGVPMIPRPKSEAWLLCAWRAHHGSCADLERESGNDGSPKNLKDQLEKLLGLPPTAENLRDKVAESFDIERITMPSFRAFRERLETVIECVPGGRR